MQRLKMKHRAGLGGSEVVAYRSRLMDLLVKEILAENSTHSASSATSGLSNMATVAIGGYGRGELAPFSDVDLMFLRKSRQAPEEASQIQTMLCLLWDMGFQVGHSVRTIKESLHMAQDDLTSLMSMLDARPLAGPGQLYIEFQERLRKGIDKDKKGLQEKILRSVQERHQAHGGTVFIQEPNIKEAKGGLRDFHTIGWIAKAFYPGLTREQVLERHEVTPGEWKRAAQAYEFLQRLRNELHFLTNRRTDVLSHHLLASVVKNFNFRKGRFQKDSEAFLKHYYLQVRGIAQVADALLAPIEKALKPKTSWFSSRMTALSPPKPTTKHSGSAVASTAGVNPEQWMQLFRYSQAEPSLIDESTKAAIRQHVQRFHRSALSAPPISSDFRAILRAKGKVAPVIRLMHGLGFLGRVLPEFGRLTCLVQHDLYHKYTTDEHSLRALEVLDRIAIGSEDRFRSYQRILNEIHDSSTLYFAMLMHDVGKGLGGSHSVKGAELVGKALARLRFDPDEAAKVDMLVRHHLLMGHISQRRNLDDPHTIDEFVRIIDRLDTLNMLLLLTFADAQAIGPGVWNEWKDHCLWELYHKAYERLMFAGSRSRAIHSEVDSVRKQVFELLKGEVDAEVLENHFKRLPEKYVLYTPVPQIVNQLRLARKLDGEAMVLEWVDHPEQGYTDLILVTHDRPGLFAQIAGGLSAFNLNILSAQLNTRDDGMVFDVFQVGSLAGTHRLHREDYARVERLLKRVIGGQTEIEEYLKTHSTPALAPPGQRLAFPPRVHIDNEISPVATVIEVQAADRLGLGYHIAKTLASFQLNIVFAKLATEKAHAFDVFYVRNAAGGKVLDAEQMRRLEEQLRSEVLELT
jgi:[protein-PII] uridylyltransferase